MDGWRLLSAEDRHAEAPTTFWIPSREERQRLEPGNAAKLLFEITDLAEEPPAPRVERMWVVVTGSTEAGYVGVLGNSPSSRSDLHRGSVIAFSAEHICDTDVGPSEGEFEELLRLSRDASNQA